MSRLEFSKSLRFMPMVAILFSSGASADENSGYSDDLKLFCRTLETNYLALSEKEKTFFFHLNDVCNDAEKRLTQSTTPSDFFEILDDVRLKFHDAHMRLLPTNDLAGAPLHVGLAFSYIDSKIVVTKNVSQDTPIHAGDTLLAVDGSTARLQEFDPLVCTNLTPSGANGDEAVGGSFCA